MLPSLYVTAADLFSMIHLYTIRNFRKSQVFLPFQRVKKEIFHKMVLMSVSVLKFQV